VNASSSTSPLTLTGLIAGTNNSVRLRAVYAVNQGVLPLQLEVLSCVNNRITELENLPDTLNLLDCRYNFIKVAPTVPKHCQLFSSPTLDVSKYADLYTAPAIEVNNSLEFLNVPTGAEDIITYDEIKSGDKLADFEGEAQHDRYYLKSTFNSLPTPKINPETRKAIKKVKIYTARLKKLK
jgi:hypothetical protein